MRKIGDRVVIKKDIQAGDTFPVKGDNLRRIGFTRKMAEYRGCIATIMEYREQDGLFIGYVLDISPLHTFSEDMLEEETFSYDTEAEELINHMLKLIPSQLIDHSLETRNEILFMELTHDSVDKR